MPRGPKYSSRFGEVSQCSMSSTSWVISSVVMCRGSRRTHQTRNSQSGRLRTVLERAMTLFLVTLTACGGQDGRHEIAPCDSSYPQGQRFYVHVTNDRLRVQTGVGTGA